MGSKSGGCAGHSGTFQAFFWMQALLYLSVVYPIYLHFLLKPAYAVIIEKLVNSLWLTQIIQIPVQQFKTKLKSFTKTCCIISIIINYFLLF